MHVVIIGNGISGITAARTLRKKSDCTITVISSETKYFFSRTALMYVYMGHMKFEHTQPYENFFWEKNRIDLVQDKVEKIDPLKKLLFLESGNEISFDKLILATGSKSNKFGWKGQDLKGVQGLYSHQDLELLEKNTQGPNESEKNKIVDQAVIIGGGLIGVELAEMLMTRKIAVIFFVREDRFWGNILPKEESNLILKELSDHGVSVRFKTELDEIIADENGRVKEVKTTEGEIIACQLVGLTAGVSPNIDFLRESGIKVDRGVRVNRKLETSHTDIFAAGDCAEFIEPPYGRKSIEQVWYTGRMMGEIVACNILGENIEYAPGPWFNSAKFFDIEYQTYGMVGNELKEGEEMFFWQEQKEKKCLKVISNESSGKFVGINVFGIRLRHECFDRWLRESRSTDFVMEHLRDAVFDPEFYKDEVANIVRQYNLDKGKQINARKFKWKR